RAPADALAPAAAAAEKAFADVEAAAGRNRFAGLYPFVETLVVVVGVVAPLRAYFFQPFKIPTGSMQPTLYGIHAEDAEFPDFFDSWTPLKVAKWAVTGRWWRDAVAHADGTMIVSTDHLRAPGYNLFTLAGETYKLPADVLVRHERQLLRVADPMPDNPQTARTELLRGSVRRGDRVWSGYVVSGDQVFVNRVLWYLRPPKRDEVVVFSTFGLSLSAGSAASAPPRQGTSRLAVQFFGLTLAYDAAPIPGLPPWQFYIKRCVGLPRERISIDPPHVLSGGEPVRDAPGMERVAGMGPSASGPSYAGYHNTGDAELGRIANPNAPLGKKGDAIAVGDAYLPMGDNTLNSLDGRYWGTVPRTQMLGPGSFVYWPVSKRWGAID
ncbi:MAG: hypothetical protein IJ783_01525, partial [Kiritimatiellae bacterium]|nr:hypothetical protein [Kiritimatiellia bacterium]